MRVSHGSQNCSRCDILCSVLQLSSSSEGRRVVNCVEAWQVVCMYPGFIGSHVSYLVVQMVCSCRVRLPGTASEFRVLCVGRGLCLLLW